MKWFKRIGLAVIALIIVVVVIVYFSLNSIVRSQVEKQTQASLSVPTSLSSARLSLFGGTVSLGDLELGSPTGFTAPKMLTVNSTDVAVSYGQLRSTPIHIKQIVIDKPTLVVEQAGTRLNLKALMDQIPPSSGEPMKLIVDDLQLNNATVDFMANLPGMSKDIQVAVPSLELKDIGNANGAGASMKEVVMQVATALAAKAGQDSKLPMGLNAVLSGDLGPISQQLGGDFNKQIQNISPALTKNLPAGVTNLINGATSQPSDQLKQGLNGLLGGSKK